MGQRGLGDVDQGEKRFDHLGQEWFALYFIFRLVGLSPKEVKMLDQIQRACREQT
jgi:hypothetical protein